MKHDTRCPVSHDHLKATPSLWDAHIVNRRSQAVMIPGTDIGECRHCLSSLTLIVDQAAYDAFWAEDDAWETKTVVTDCTAPSREYSADRDPRSREGFVGVAA